MSISLDEVSITVSVKGQDVQLDLLEAELFLQKEVDDKEADVFVPKVQELFRSKGVEGLSFSQAVNFCHYIRAAYIEHKKKFDSELKLAFPSVSTRSQSPNENS